LVATRDSAIAEELCVSSTLHWRSSKWIHCSWTNASFWDIRIQVIQYRWKWRYSMDCYY